MKPPSGDGGNLLSALTGALVTLALNEATIWRWWKQLELPLPPREASPPQ